MKPATRTRETTIRDRAPHSGVTATLLATDPVVAAPANRPSLLERSRNFLRSHRFEIVLFLAAVVLYLPGVRWGLPHVTHSTIPHGWEVDTVSGLATLSELHNLLIAGKPDWYVAYPLLHYVLLGALYVPYLGYLLLTGGMAQPTGAYPYGLADPVSSIATMALIGRLVSVFMAAGAIVGVYVIGKRAWNSTAGLIAASAYAVCVPLTYYGRMANLDVPVLFWTTMGLVAISKCVVDGLTVKRGVILGVLAAITVATKDQGYAAWVCALLMIIYFHQRQLSKAVPLTDRARWVAPLAVVLSGAVAYAVLSGVIFWPHRFAAHISFVANFKKTFFNVVHLNVLRPISASGYAQLVVDMADCALEAVGPINLILAAAGAWLTRRSRLTQLLLVVLCGHLAMTVFPIRHMQYRYILLPSLVLCLLAANALVSLAKKHKLAAVMAGACAFAWPALMSIDLTYQMIYDARYDAAKWFASRAKAGEGMAYFGSPDQVPPLPHGVEPVRMEWAGPPDVVLNDRKVRFVAIMPEHSSRSTGWAVSFADWGLDRSKFLPEDIYQRLQDGSLGYQKVAAFRTMPLFWNRPVKFLPWLNPPVQVFERTIPFTASVN